MARQLTQSASNSDKPAMRIVDVVRAFTMLFVFMCMHLPSLHAESRPGFQDQWRWTRYGIEHGLCSNQITHIIETDDGIMWAGTSLGLCYFDEFRWHWIRNDKGVPEAPVDSVVTGTDHQIMAVVGGRLYRGGTSGFFNVDVADAPRVFNIRTVARFNDTFLVTGWRSSSEDLELFQYNQGELRSFPTPSRLPAISYGRCDHNLFSTADGRTWLNTVSGLYFWSEGTWKLWIPASILPLEVINITTDRSGNGIANVAGPFSNQLTWLWQSTGKPTLMQTDTSERVRAIASGPRNTRIAVYESNIVRLFKENAWQVLVSPPSELRHASCLHFASNGNLWAGTRRGILVYRDSSNRWTYWQHPFPSRKNWINEILPLSDGSVWIATADGIDIRYPDGRLEELNDIDGTPLGIVTGLHCDGSGRIWVTSGSGFKGAYCREGLQWRHYDEDDGLPDAYYHKVCGDSHDRVWLLGLSRHINITVNSIRDDIGACVLEQDTFTVWNAKTGLLHGRVYSFAETRDGALWFGTLKGVSRYLDGKWKHWTPQDGLKYCRAFSLAADGKEGVWLADQKGGLCHIGSDDKPTYYTEADGLVSNSTQDLEVDNDGNLWISTTEGLSCYNNGVFANFGADLGLEYPTLWPIVSDGIRVYAGSSGGGTMVLNLEEADLPGPQIYLEPAILDYRFAQLRWQPYSFRGTVPSELIETRYRIDGQSWSAWSADRRATLNDLNGSEHLFEVQAKGIFGDYDANGQSLTFTVPQPFYSNPLYLIPLIALAVLAFVLSLSLSLRRRKYEQSLRFYQYQLQSIADNTNVIIYLKDVEGRYLLVNRKFEAIVGVDRSKIVGKTAYDIFATEEAELFHAHIRDVIAAQAPVSTEEIVTQADGPHIYLSTSSPLFDAAGKIYAICGISTDITERKQAEEALRRSDKMDTLGILAAGIAHDFSGLVALILRNIELVRSKTSSDSPSLHNLDVAEQAVQQAIGMTKALQAVIHRSSTEKRIVSLGEVCQAASRLLSHLIGVTVVQVWEISNAPLYILADPTQIQQVLMNLVANARDAVPAGGQVRITLDMWDSMQQCTPSATRSPYRHYARLRVADNGVGMTSEVKDHIFEPLYTTKANQARTGLGLAIVSRIVEDHDGWIEVDSTPGHGTTFTVYLPCEDEAARTGSDQNRTAPPAGSTVLIVDSNNFERSFLATTMRDDGYRVKQASTATACIELCNTERIDALVMSAALPDMTANQFLETLSAENILPPTVIITENADDTREMLEPDLDFPIIAKPFSMDEIRHVIANIIGNHTHSSREIT